MATTSIADKLAKLEKKIAKREKAIADETNLNGLVYAPFGKVDIKAQNLNLNNVIIIADSITINCPNVNANYGCMTHMQDKLLADTKQDTVMWQV